MIGAVMSGKKGGNALHIANHVHIYEQHIPEVLEYLSRKPEPLDGARIEIAKSNATPIDIQFSNKHAREFISVVNYKGRTQPQIKFDIVA